MKKIFLLSAVMFSISGFSQKIQFTYNDSIEVLDNANAYENPWFGGLQSPQFSNIDIDLDGKTDLFVFDKYDQSILIFLNKNNTYKYYPHYAEAFPKLNNWVLLRDYNCDGKEDIFTGNLGGVAVYKNISTANNPKFELKTSYLTGLSGPVQVPSGDIPSIEDVDFDGDMDILTFDVGGSYVIYFKNLQKENALDCADLSFDTETVCWGDFREGGLDNSITLGDDCGGNIMPENWFEHHPLGAESGVVHSGSSLMAFDNDGDRDMDLLVGDISGQNLVLLENGKDSSNAVMDNVITNFPTSTPVDLYVFPTGYYLDVTFDGKKDLVVSPNDAAENSSNNFEQTLLYENTGTVDKPELTFSKKNFLLDNTVELGAGAAPEFVDFDLDGDLDLVVGNFMQKTDPTIQYNGLFFYENTGSATSPKFLLKNKDFANTSSLGYYSTYPSFADLDDDGDKDMMLGEFNGKFFYFQNTADSGAPMNLVLDSAEFGGIDVGYFSSPTFGDIDKDGDLDMISGDRLGKIHYFENAGTPQQPHFKEITDSLGHINLKDSIMNVGYTTPKLLDFDLDDKVDLVTGSYNGNVKFYSDIANKINSSASYIENTYYHPFSNTFSDVNFGRRSIPALADLNGDKLPEMVIGLYRGGLVYLKNESDDTLGISSIESNLLIYPNPFTNLISIDGLEKNSNFIIYGILGTKILEGTLNTNNPTINTTELATGNYVVIVFSEHKIEHKQLIIKLRE